MVSASTLPFCYLPTARRFERSAQRLGSGYGSVLVPFSAVSADRCLDGQVWTVNGKPEMMRAISWGVDAVLTDKPADYLALRGALQSMFLVFS
jgi:hypothetical protein